MAITYTSIPSSLRVPGSYAEIDGSNALAVAGTELQRVIIVGLRLSTGTATAGQIVAILSETDGDALFGSKSQLAAMTRGFKRVNRSAELWAMPLDENAAGTAASGSFAFTGTSTKDWSLVARVGDQRVAVGIASGSTATQIATALSTAANATDRLPFSTTPSTGTVALVHRHKGTVGNTITIEIESIPPGVTVVTTQPTGGATDTDVSAFVTALDDRRYDTVVTGFNSAANMLILENELGRRWGGLVKQPGMVIAGLAGSHGAMTTYGAARNSQFATVIGSALSPTPSYVWAAQVAANDSLVNDTTNPNRPRNGMVMPDCEAPKLADRLDPQERNLLLYDGISTFKVDPSGRVVIERLITTYQVNTNGLNDTTYLNIETMRNLAGIYLEALSVGGKYARHLLAPDGTEFDAGVPVVTPAIYKGEMISLNESLERRGRTKNAEAFKSALICEINGQDPNRLDVQISPGLVGPLVVVANKIAFTV